MTKMDTGLVESAGLVERMARTQGKTPMSFGYKRNADVPLVFPIGREIGQIANFACLSGEENYLNTVVSAAKGKGKTSCIIKPFIRWMICHPQRMGSLILDAKGDLTSTAIQWAREVGREEDVIILDPRGDFKVRLLPGDMCAETLASIIVSAIATINGGFDPREQFWIAHSEELLKYVITLVRMSEGEEHYPVNPEEINRLVGMADEQQRLLNRVEWRNDNGEYQTPHLRHNVEYLRRYFTLQKELDPRVETSITAEVRRYLKDYSGYNFARVFCPGPKEKCIDMADIFNRGRIVILSMPSCLYADTARLTGVLLKSQFYDLVGRRMLEGSNIDSERPVFFICDEYQQYMSVGGRVGSDDTFAAISRYARAGMVCAVQELGALYSAAGPHKEDAATNLILNFQNHIIMQQTMTPRLETLLAGKGIRDLGCIPMLQSFEALVVKDTEPVPRIVETGPNYANWDYVLVRNEQQARQLQARRQDIYSRCGLNDEKGGIKNIIIVGEHNGGKTKLLEYIYQEHLKWQVPCVLMHGKMDLNVQPINLLAELARICGMAKDKIEGSTIIVDDIDTLTAELGKMNNGLYVGLLPFVEGKHCRYGKHNDVANLGKVRIIATATLRHDRKGIGFISNTAATRKPVLPGIISETFRVIEMHDIAASKQITKSTAPLEDCHEK